MAIDFDGDNLVITLDAPVAGVLTMSAEVDLYNEWKDWMLASPDNRKYPQAFRTIGGDSLTPGIDAGAYFFIQNNLGWRIRPYEADATVFLSGNLAPEDSSLPIMIPTIGAYTVLVDGLQPITQNIDTIKDTLEFTSFNSGVYLDAVNGVLGTDGTKGNEANPVKLLSDAKIIATERGFSKLWIIGAFTFGATDDIDDFYIDCATSTTSVTVISGCSTGNTTFNNLEIQGVLSGVSVLTGCNVHSNGLSGVDGTLKSTTLTGDITLANAADTHLYDCRSGVPGTGHPSVISVGGAINLGIRAYAGGIGLQSITDGNVSVDMISGHVKAYSTCTGGTIVIRGVYKFTDESTGSTINLTDSTADLLAPINNRRKHDKTANTITVYQPNKTTPRKVYDADDELTDISPQ